MAGQRPYPGKKTVKIVLDDENDDFSSQLSDQQIEFIILKNSNDDNEGNCSN